MNDSDLKLLMRERARADRLVAFVQDELRNMMVQARLDFTAQLFEYLTPEISELLRQEKIKAPERHGL